MQFLISVPFRLFPSRLYFLFWITYTASALGTWIHEVASSWFMTSQHTEAVWTGALQAAAFLPFILIAPLAGALADRMSLRTWLTLAQAWCFLIALVLGILAWRDLLTAESLVFLTALLSVGAAGSSPVFHALLPHMVSKDEMPSAVATYYMGANVGRALGPAIAGLVIGTLGVPTAFLLNSISFLGIIVFLTKYKPGTNAHPEKTQAAKTETAARESVLEYLRQGYQHAFSQPRLRAGLQEIFLFTFFGTTLWSLLPVLARFQIHMTATTYGHLLSFLGIGAVITGLLLSCFVNSISMVKTLRVSILLMAFAFLLLGFANEQLAFAASFLAGVAWITFVSLGNSYLQASLDGKYRSRVMAIYVSVFFLGLALGSLVWSVIADLVGVAPTFWIISAGLLLQGLFLNLPSPKP